MCVNAAPIIYRGDLRLVSEYGSSNGYVDGSEPQFYDIRHQPIEQGRWLDWTDERQRNSVCVIGKFVAILFPGRAQTMNTLNQKLDPALFIRIHRSRIVRARRIRELRAIDNREYIVMLKDGSEHRSSRSYAGRLDYWLSSEARKAVPTRRG